jgi:NADH-quinone oxidoreductase subunit A
MNFTFLVVVLLTALAFVGVVIALSRAISPRSYNEQKFEAYECGIPTRGKSWMQFRVGYYLFAILFLMFDGVAGGRGVFETEEGHAFSNWAPRAGGD